MLSLLDQVLVPYDLEDLEDNKRIREEVLPFPFVILIDRHCFIEHLLDSVLDLCRDRDGGFPTQSVDDLCGVVIVLRQFESLKNPADLGHCDCGRVDAILADFCANPVEDLAVDDMLLLALELRQDLVQMVCV